MALARRFRISPTLFFVINQPARLVWRPARWLLFAGLFAIGIVRIPAEEAEKAPIVLSMSTALSGPAAALGHEMRMGVLVGLARVIRAGGVNGRKLQLIALDDGYEPVRTAPNMRELIDQDKVLAVIGNVGTPTAIAALPIALEQKTALAVATLIMAPHPPRAVVMVGAYAPCAKFIHLCRGADLRAVFLNVSFVGNGALAKELGSTDATVVVTQVVPSPVDRSLPIVRDYLADLNAQDPAATACNGDFEGYVAARIFLRALEKIKGAPSRENIVHALESLGSFDIGLGTPLALCPNEHQACHRVWLTILKNGEFVPFAWKDIYLAQTILMLDGLKEAVLTNAGSEVASLAHKLIGSSVSCGLEAFTLPLRKPEKMGRTGDLTGAKKLLDDICETLPRLPNAFSLSTQTIQHSEI